MKVLNVEVDIQYDHTLYSQQEVVYNVQRALDEYFNRYETEVGSDDGLKIVGVSAHEKSPVVSGRDQS